MPGVWRGAVWRGDRHPGTDGIGQEVGGAVPSIAFSIVMFELQLRLRAAVQIELGGRLNLGGHHHHCVHLRGRTVRRVLL